MTDIVERLRDGAGADGWVHPDVAHEAADEIERLRNDRDDSDAASNDREAEIERLRKENARLRIRLDGRPELIVIEKPHE